MSIAGGGAILYKDGEKVWEILVPMPVGSTNNEAEFATLVKGLQELRDEGKTGPAGTH